MSDEQSAAILELSRKSLRQIQVETARTWAYRSWAARALAAASTSIGKMDKAECFRMDALEYGHEALEHAALTGSDDVLREVRAILADSVSASF